LKGFAKIEDRCTFAIDDQTGQRTFLDDLKSGIRYIIEYVLASTYSEDATLSVEFNTIVKALNKVITGDEKSVYSSMKDAFMNAGGNGANLDTVYQKLADDNKDNVDFLKKLKNDFITLL